LFSIQKCQFMRKTGCIGVSKVFLNYDDPTVVLIKVKYSLVTSL